MKIKKIKCHDNEYVYINIDNISYIKEGCYASGDLEGTEPTIYFNNGNSLNVKENVEELLKLLSN